jgi:hypothetical protein
MNVPVMVTCFILLAITESFAMFARRKRDHLLSARDLIQDEMNFRANVAKESRFGWYRPYLSFSLVLGIFINVSYFVDEFGQCFWNWECWSDIDCNVRILLPAVLTCIAEVIGLLHIFGIKSLKSWSYSSNYLKKITEYSFCFRYDAAVVIVGRSAFPQLCLLLLSYCPSWP